MSSQLVLSNQGELVQFCLRISLCLKKKKKFKFFEPRLSPLEVVKVFWGKKKNIDPMIRESCLSRKVGGLGTELGGGKAAVLCLSPLLRKC